MNKRKDLLKYLIVLIVISFSVLGNTGYISHIILSNFRKEFVPVISINQDGEFSLVEELFPVNSDREGNDYDLNSSLNNSINGIQDDRLNNGVINSDVINNEALNDEVTNNEFTDIETLDNVALDNSSSENSQDELTSQSGDDSSVESSVEASAINSSIPANIGITYSMEQLNDFEFLIGNCYTIDGSTSITSEDINIETMLTEDLSLDMSGDEYKVLIYHSHGSETFINSRPGVTEDSIIGVGDELTRILQEDYGIKTYHDRTVYDVVDGKLDRNYAYTASGYGIDKILEQYPSIEVVLDIHRDGVRDDVHLMKVIDGKPTAQIMFFNGISRLNDEGELGYLHNPNRSSNLSFSLQMHLKGKELYGDLMRKIYIGGYCYNLDRKPRASLIEVGAQTNTVEEAKNAMIPLAAILYSVLNGS